jgi:HTH-type transcriptional regulator, competence development regulator
VLDFCIFFFCMDDTEKRQFLRRLGEWVAKIRRSKGIPQDQLTEDAGLAKGTVSKIENGLVDARVTTLLKVAKALSMPFVKMFAWIT